MGAHLIRRMLAASLLAGMPNLLPGAALAAGQCTEDQRGSLCCRYDDVLKREVWSNCAIHQRLPKLTTKVPALAPAAAKKPRPAAEEPTPAAAPGVASVPDPA